VSVNNNFPRTRFKRNYDEDTIRQLVQSTNFAIDGKTNNTGEVTLTANAASTAVTNNLCNVNSVILLQPKTANAAAALATTYCTAGDGSFTVTHANNSQTDKEFKYVVIG